MDIVTIDEAKLALHNDKLCRVIGGAIYKAYPHHVWQVEVLDKGQSCYIKLPLISHAFGLFFRVMDSEKKNIKRAVFMAGEMQERFKLGVGTSSSEDIRELKHGSKGSVLGSTKGEYDG